MQDTGLPAASLQNLNDIVLPPAAPLFPPAPGWYVLFGIILFALFWYGVRAILKYRRNRYRRAALSALQGLKASNDQSAWREIPGLVKRTALAIYPRSEVASTSGNEWLGFLQHSAGRSKIDPAAGELLQRAAYQMEPLSDAELAILFSSTEEWIKHHSLPG